MNAVASSSKMNENIVHHPHKKRKVDDEVNTVNNSTNIDVLPDEMLMKIFSYLSVIDRIKTQKVCHRWYQLVRSEFFWKHLKLSNLTSAMLSEIISNIPSCALRLSLGCDWEAISLSLPDIMAKFHKQCLNLNTLILENIYLVKNMHNFHFTQDNTLYENIVLDFKCSNIDQLSEQIIENKFRKEDNIELLDAVLPELKVLSLRQILFNTCDIFSHISTVLLPKLVVLDLSYSQHAALQETTSNNLFSKLENLEELYLAGWTVSDYFMMNLFQNMKNLRVLDLEDTQISDIAFSALKETCTKLEKLYFCFNNVGDICRFDEEKVFLPHLQLLCMRITNVTSRDIEKLFIACPSLKLINVSLYANKRKNWYHDLSIDLKNRLFFDPRNRFKHCDHFLNTKYYNF